MVKIVVTLETAAFLFLISEHIKAHKHADNKLFYGLCEAAASAAL